MTATARYDTNDLFDITYECALRGAGQEVTGTYTKETLNKARLTALHAICLQIFRHIA